MSCFPKINWVDSGVLSTIRCLRSEVAYHKFAFTGEISLLDAFQGVVLLSFAERGAMYICGEEADGGQDARVESGLISV